MRRTLGEWLKAMLRRALIWVPASSFICWLIVGEWKDVAIGALGGLCWASTLTHWNFRDAYLGRRERAQRRKRKPAPGSIEERMEDVERVMSQPDKLPIERD